MKNKVPEEVIDALNAHIKSASLKGEEGWVYGKEDEDTLTGDFLGQLRTGTNKIGDWQWKITYNKFRGRGPNAYEKTVGADGIITIEIEKGGKRETKSVIFQAKKKGNNDTAEQLEKMRNTLPKGNMVIVYSNNGYFGETGTDYTNNKKLGTRIGDYLADVFVACRNGVWGVDYDANKGELRFSDHKIARANLKHELKIKILEKK